MCLFFGLSNGCDFSIDAPVLPYTPFEAETLVALGDGYMAGYTNSTRSSEDIRGLGGLYEGGQIHSIPRLIIGQYNELRETHDVKPVLFRQPIAYGNGSGRLNVEVIAAPGCDFLPTYALKKIDLPESNWMEPADPPIHNFALPHLRMSQINKPIEGPFGERLFPGATQSYQTLSSEAEADLFLMWLGTNDLLEYALGGGEGGLYEITAPEIFATNLEQYLKSLIHSGKRGLIGTVPDVSLFPYFHTVPRTYVPVQSCNVIPKSIYIECWVDSQLTVRVASPSDLLLLPAKDLIGNGNSFGLSESNPVPHRWVLDQVELDKLRERKEAFNNAIEQLAEELNADSLLPSLSVVRLDQTFDQLRDGKFETGVYVDNRHLTGGIFNLDGLYLSPRGNALIANHFIRELNRLPGFNATLPVLNLREFSGVLFP